MKKVSVEAYEEQKSRPTYTWTPEEKKKVGRMERDFQAMINARAVIDKDRPLYQRMMEAIPRDYQDDRSSSTVPLASAIIELFVAKASKIQTEFTITGENTKYKQSALLRQKVWDYDRRTNNRREEIIDNEYTTAWFWRSVLRTGYEVETVKQYELDEVKEDGEMTWVDKDITEEKIILQNIDVRSFYLDNNTTRGIKTAKKCMVRTRKGYDDFLDLKNNKLYKNIEYVVPKNYNSEYMPYSTKEEMNKQGKFVELREYWNLTGDVYCVWANGIIIREHHIISTVKGRKCLPFTTRVLGKKIGRYDTGRWLCETLLRFNSELNDLREMLMDWIRRSNNPTIAIGNWLTFSGRKFSWDSEVLEFDWDMQKWFQQLQGVPPNQAIFEYMNNLFEQIAVFVGIDIKNILWVPQQTAYQTNVQVESSQERVNVWLTNRDLSFERMANQHMENLVRFFPRQTAEGLYPELEIEDYEVTGSEDKPSLVWSKGNSWLLQITPELLAGETYIDVYTNISRPPSDIANRQSKLEFATSASALLNLKIQATQAWIEMPEIDRRIKELEESYDLSTEWEEVDKKQLQEWNSKFLEWLSSMMWANPLAQQLQSWQPQGQLQQASSENNLAPSFSPWMIWS